MCLWGKQFKAYSSCPAFSPSSTLPSLCLPTSLSHSSPNITFNWSPPAPQPPALDTPLPPSTSESQGEPITISFPSNIQSLGFPNIGNSCYMNATLQALLGLSSFTSDLMRHRHCWESPSSAPLMRNMGDLQLVRQNTRQANKKRPMLKNIRRSISTICPEFSGDHQQSTEVEFSCGVCSGRIASLKLHFFTQPRVLVLHLKRFGDISGTTKSSNPINIPLQLDLSRYNRGVSMGQLIPSYTAGRERSRAARRYPPDTLYTQNQPSSPSPLQEARTALTHIRPSYETTRGFGRFRTRDQARAYPAGIPRDLPRFQHPTTIA
ncbi:hypothetical protein ACEWY4_001644 [Coilia grayii]|uniref:Peptidase C19 ubiquitin carboxyl-terminal hydrolase domain-containing protein n=1 Tax=Coilia grayii TaxID=363190 RepID=A0ABD1KTJ0_9TELE